MVPLFHRYEFMDLTLKSFEISRQGSEGLICKDNIRADIKVAFFIRVDSSHEEMKEVAQSIGARRCSELETLARIVRRQVQRSVEDGRQAIRFRRSVRPTRQVQGRDPEGHRHRLERLSAR